jgi:glycosyltransferase involved in cell wall biosynthesis
MRHRLLRKYRERELDAWRTFDVLIAISQGEAEYVGRQVPNANILLAPMGVDTSEWRRTAEPAQPMRIGYYGAMSNPQNSRDALRCYRAIMPVIWEQHSDAGFWIVGSGAGKDLRDLATVDPRVHVTGYVPDVRPVLSSLSLVLCPFEGTFGFRSRIIEVMALGIPVIVSPDAIHGMGLEEGAGVFTAKDDERFAHAAIDLLDSPLALAEQSRKARVQVEDKFSFPATYGRLANELHGLCAGRRDHSEGTPRW